MGKKLNPTRSNRSLFRWLVTLVVAAFFLLVIALGAFEKQYEGKIYPRVTVGGVSFGGQTPWEVEEYWLVKNQPFAAATFEFRFEQYVATVSGLALEAGYDASLSATQAYLIGRSGNFFTDIYQKFRTTPINLTPVFRWNAETLEELLEPLATSIDIPVQDALFQFSNGRVTAFKPSRSGRRLNLPETKKRLAAALSVIPTSPTSHLVIDLPVDTLTPSITTDRVNSFGIKELIGRGYSEFTGSIASRIHNITLAAAKLNGLLIKPGETFSFNEAVGDISAATGFQPAYIIKEGRTVLGDGGGVCQVSTTLFRAALNAGLPIAERQAHAYRVQYYELAGFKAGLDATVFAPSVDLKIKNDTPGYILIQAKVDRQKQSLTFELYGTGDGRKAEIFNHQVWGLTPPPPPLYQDDPTLPPGVTKQVDWAAWGAKASFQYRVTRAGEVLQNTTFYSNFRPWQAVYLRGVPQ